MSSDDDYKPLFSAMEKSTLEIFENGRRVGALEFADEVLRYLQHMHGVARNYGGAALDRHWIYGQEVAFRNAIKDVTVMKEGIELGRRNVLELRTGDDE